nr:ATP-binding protein [Nocardioides marinus]
MLRKLERGQRSLLHNVPPRDPHELIGRDSAVKDIRNWLRPYPHSSKDVVLIDGVGGVGKTALAKSIAYSYVDEGTSEDFAAIVWISGKMTELTVEIRSLPPRLRTIDDLYRAIAMTLRRTDIMEKGPEERAAIITDVLSDHDNRVLLIVDNLETVEDTAVLSFIEHPPVPTKVLATSRHRLESGTFRRLSGLRGEAAQELVRAHAAALDVDLSDDEVEALARETDGVPLAIFFTLGQLAIGYPLSEALDRLRSANGDYAEFAFHESVERLSDANHANERELLYATSLFVDGASAEALGWVAGLSDAPRDVARTRALRNLNAMSLLNYKDGRFNMLSLTRDFVRGDLGRDIALKNRVTQRWLSWHRDLADRAFTVDLDSGVLELLRQEHSNVIGAIDHAHTRDKQLFHKFVTSMAFFWLTEGLWDEFEHYVSSAKLAAPNIAERLRLSNRLLWLSVLRMDLDMANVHKSESELLLRRSDVPYERMRLSDFSGQLALALGDAEEATRWLSQGLAEAISLSDRRGVFATQKYLGEVSCMIGDLDAARRQYEQAAANLGGPGEAEWVRGQAHLAHLQGLIAEGASDPDTALAAYEDCLAFLATHRDVRLATRAKEGRARSLKAFGKAAEARDVYADVARDFELLGMWDECNSARSLAEEGMAR